jgi:hypothetical protein
LLGGAIVPKEDAEAVLENCGALIKQGQGGPFCGKALR